MGKTIVLSNAELLNPDTWSVGDSSGTSRILGLFEATQGGIVDISSSVYLSVTGENLVLSPNKVYIALICSHDLRTSSASLCQNYLKYRGNVHQHNAFLGTNIVDKITDKTKVEQFANNQYRTVKKDFRFYTETYAGYAGLVRSITTCILKPATMEDKELDDLTSNLGGIEDFDTRILIKGSDEDLQWPKLFEYILKSRTFIFPSPVITSHENFKSLLYPNHILTRGKEESIRDKNNMYPSLASRDSDLYDLLIIRNYVNNFWALLIKQFSPIQLIKLWGVLLDKTRDSAALTPPYSLLNYEWINVWTKGTLKMPSVYKAKVPPNSTIQGWFPPSFQAVGSPNLISRLKRLKDRYDKEELGPLESSILKAIISTCSRISTALNSTTYLSRELAETLNIELDDKVRWKGGRYSGEKSLAGLIYSLKCYLKTSTNLKHLLENHLGGRSQISHGLLQFGCVLRCLSGKPNVLTTNKYLKFLHCRLTSPRRWQGEKGKGMTLEPKKRLNVIGSAGTNILSQMAYMHLVTHDISGGFYYRDLVDTCLEVLTYMFSARRKAVRDTLKAGIQTCDNGELFKDVLYADAKATATNLYTDISEDSSIHHSCLYHGDINVCQPLKEISYITGSYGRTLVEDFYLLLQWGIEKSPYEVKDIWLDEILVEIKKAINFIVELKSAVVLKTKEEYFINSTMGELLDTSYWDKLKDL